MDNQPLERTVEQVELELVKCSFRECSDRGNLVRCYSDIFTLCPRYITHKNYLKTVREMKANRKYKRN